MRCLSCNKILNNKETSRRGIHTMDYCDLCDSCYSTIAEDTPTIVNTTFEDEHEFWNTTPNGPNEDEFSIFEDGKDDYN